MLISQLTSGDEPYVEVIMEKPGAHIMWFQTIE